MAFFRHGSMENVDRKEENIAPKTESRPESRMGKITENEDKGVIIEKEITQSIG